MAAKLCLRCDWTGRTSSASCPRCGAQLYDRADRERNGSADRAVVAWMDRDRPRGGAGGGRLRDDPALHPGDRTVRGEHHRAPGLPRVSGSRRRTRATVDLGPRGGHGPTGAGRARRPIGPRHHLLGRGFVGRAHDPAGGWRFGGGGAARCRSRCTARAARERPHRRVAGGRRVREPRALGAARRMPEPTRRRHRLPREPDQRTFARPDRVWATDRPPPRFDVPVRDASYRPNVTVDRVAADTLSPVLRGYSALGATLNGDFPFALLVGRPGCTSPGLGCLGRR